MVFNFFGIEPAPQGEVMGRDTASTFLPLGADATCIAVNEKTICTTFTDDNVGETLIIKSDKGNYENVLGMFRSHFSVTNNSGTQNVRFVVTAPDKWELRDVLRNNGAVMTDIPAITRIEPATATTTEQTIIVRPAYSEPRTNWTDLSKRPTTSKNNPLMKPVVGKSLGENDVMDVIKAGETKYYSASFYTNGQDGEFFIEAFGDAGAYGHLDPTAFNGEENFESYTAGTDINGGTGGTGWSAGWSGGTAFDSSTTQKYEGSKSMEFLNAASATISRTLTTAQSEMAIYFALRRSHANIGSGMAFDMKTGATYITNLQYIQIAGTNGIHIHNGTSWTNLQTATADTWYPVNVEFDDAVQPDKQRARVYVSGAWNAFSAWLTTSAAYATVGGVTLTSPGTETTAYWDTICGTDITAGGCAAAAVATVNPRDEYNEQLFFE